MADEDDETVRRWGALFAVFGAELDLVLDNMAEALGADDLAEEVGAAARRYGALLEVMCIGGEKRPCMLYDCCDGVGLLLVRQRESRNAEVDAAMARFAAQQTTITEPVFLGILSQGIRSFFAKHVPDEAGLVTVSFDGGDYLFMREEARDTILKNMHIGTTADLY